MTTRGPVSDSVRLIIHKFDPAVPAPGGIDTCIRGIVRYADQNEPLAIIGVTADAGMKGPLGQWREVELYGRRFWFMPVARLDPGNQVRRIPHSLRIAFGVMRHKHRIPRAHVIQTHRADLALVTTLLPAAARDYFIHTQDSGILGADSDSFWRRSAHTHRSIERFVVRRASSVKVFNPTYAETVRTWNANAEFSPTWWDPALIKASPSSGRARKRLLWVGRMEVPKNPRLAVEVLAALQGTGGDWHLTMVGAGNLISDVTKHARDLGVANSVTFTGRLAPDAVMTEMANASVLLMTSVTGYEGYPRVLVEGLASGLPVVATLGSDTGGLIVDGSNGFTAAADPRRLAEFVSAAEEIDAATARQSVAHLSAPAVVKRLFHNTGPTQGER